MFKKAAAALVFAAFITGVAHADQALDQRLSALAHAWDHAQFEVPANSARLAALQQLDGEADALVRQNPTAAEPLVWQAIILSSEAGAEGGLGALGKVTRARDLLLHAEHMNGNALGDGSVYSSLGSLYCQVPGFPIGFGDRARALGYLNRALQLNPGGIEPNYFMADCLIRGNDYVHAAEFLRRAEAAPARVGREAADAGRRRDVATLMATVRAHTAH